MPLKRLCAPPCATGLAALRLYRLTFAASRPSAGGIQYALYVPIFGRLFPGAAAFAAKPLAAKLADGAGMRAVLAQTFLDQCIHHPLLYFPCFYTTREVVEHGPSAESLAVALGKWRANMSEDMVALWKVRCWLRRSTVATC